MAGTDEIIKQATALGELITDHPAAKSLESAVSALQSDVESQRAMTDLNRFGATLEEKAAKGQPIEVADKQKLDQFQQAVMLNPLLANFQRAQMDYVDLLRKVDGAITGRGDEPVGAAPAGAGAGAAGGIMPGM